MKISRDQRKSSLCREFCYMKVHCKEVRLYCGNAEMRIVYFWTLNTWKIRLNDDYGFVTIGFCKKGLPSQRMKKWLLQRYASMGLGLLFRSQNSGILTRLPSLASKVCFKNSQEVKNSHVSHNAGKVRKKRKIFQEPIWAYIIKFPFVPLFEALELFIWTFFKIYTT